MQTLDQCLTDLVRNAISSMAEARSAREQGQLRRLTGGLWPDRPAKRPSRPTEVQMERDQALKFMHDLLRLMVQKNGSDLFITAGFPPAIKVDGKITPQSNQSAADAAAHGRTRARHHERPQAAEFESTKECNFAISPAGHRPLPRQRLRAAGPRRASCCARSRAEIPTLEELACRRSSRTWHDQARPGDLGRRHRHRQDDHAGRDGRLPQRNSYGHIITIEDPIEFVHDHKNCIITQREVGIDTENWEAR
jgi:twitching motility protein PilU